MGRTSTRPHPPTTAGRDHTARCVCGRAEVIVLEDDGARCGHCWLDRQSAPDDDTPRIIAA